MFLSLRSKPLDGDVGTQNSFCACDRRLGTLVGFAANLNTGKQPTLETNFTRGTINPGVVVRRSWFETTALEMPAGFGQFTIASILHAMGGRTRTYGQAM
jgi:hypothetical protein